MLTIMRGTAREFGLLWTTVGRTIRAQGSTIVLFFTLGWITYYVTITITGVVAPRFSWAAIPLMGAGCLIQLIVTLAAYRTTIKQAEKSIDAPKLPQLSLVALLSSLLIPFIAAYSAFGFFNDYAHDGLIATTAMVGSFTESSFLGNINPLKSTTTFFIAVITFVAMWVSARWLNGVAAKRKSATLAILSAFLTACTTFLVLFSVFRLYARAEIWVNSRVFMTWWKQAVIWIGDRFSIDLPDILTVAWSWFAEVVWPFFWNALSQRFCG